MTGFLLFVVVVVVFVLIIYKSHKVRERTANYSPSGLPAGFQSSHAHKNIATDAKAGRLWMRDERGFSKTVGISDIIRWAVEAKTQNNQLKPRPKTTN